MDSKEALDLIDSELSETIAGVLQVGMPDGADEDLKFDDQLVKDIAKATRRWMDRKLLK